MIQLQFLENILNNIQQNYNFNIESIEKCMLKLKKKKNTL